MVHPVFIDDAQIVGPAGLERAGRRVGVISHVPGSLADIGRSLPALICDAVQRAGNRRNGNAANLCNVLQFNQINILPFKNAKKEIVYVSK